MAAIPASVISRWKTTGTKSQQVAAHLAIWAAAQSARTIVPPDDLIIRDLDTITSPTSVRRALRLLADEGVLRHDEVTGHYYTAGE